MFIQSLINLHIEKQSLAADYLLYRHTDILLPGMHQTLTSLPFISVSPAVMSVFPE